MMQGVRITDKGRAYVAWLKSLRDEQPTRQAAFSAGAGWAFSLGPVRGLLERMPTPEVAWDRYGSRVSRRVPVVDNWAQREAFLEAWRIMLELLAVEEQRGGLTEGEEHPAV